MVCPARPVQARLHGQPRPRRRRPARPVRHRREELEARAVALRRAWHVPAGYRKDEELRAAADCAELVLQRAISAHAGLPAVGVLAFVQDMGLQAPVEHHGVWILQSADLLAWLTSQETKLDRATVQRVGATLDAALPPRAGKAKPFTLDELSRRCRRLGGAQAAPERRRLHGGRHKGPARRDHHGAGPVAAASPSVSSW
jgi:hypothetical protein